jgi:hypothetical protein
MAVAEQKKLLIFLFSSILADGFLLWYISPKICLTQALRVVFSWSFGNGAYTEPITWEQFCCLVAAGLLGYILLGLILYILSRAVSRSLDTKEAEPRVREIVSALLVVWR